MKNSLYSVNNFNFFSFTFSFTGSDSKVNLLC